MSKNKPHLLIAPLNWGLGHATRCIPLINSFIKNGHKVSIAAEGLSKKLLAEEFPQLDFISIKGFEVVYSNGNMAWAMFKQMPKIIYGIYKEHKSLKKIISDHKIDIVISDNRYGLWNKQIRSIFITHQINIQVQQNSGFFKKIIHTINHFFISKYTECWIPDFEDEPNLSGNLSHKNSLSLNVKFIGSLSRFENNVSPNKKYELVIVLSGPEPQRSIFENLICEQLHEINISTLLVRGTMDEQTNKNSKKNVTVKNFLGAKELNKVLLGTKYIICRSGYSSIMDLVAIDKTAMLIPTPGQTEQEYLAEYLSQQNLFLFQQQNDFDLKKAIKELELFDNNKFEKRINLNLLL